MPRKRRPPRGMHARRTRRCRVTFINAAQMDMSKRCTEMCVLSTPCAFGQGEVRKVTTGFRKRSPPTRRHTPPTSTVPAANRLHHAAARMPYPALRDKCAGLLSCAVRNTHAPYARSRKSARVNAHAQTGKGAEKWRARARARVLLRARARKSVRAAAAKTHHETPAAGARALSMLKYNRLLFRYVNIPIEDRGHMMRCR